MLGIDLFFWNGKYTTKLQNYVIKNEIEKERDCTDMYSLINKERYTYNIYTRRNKHFNYLNDTD